MKHKFISISIALVLALSLCLVTAVPAAAAEPPPQLDLISVGTGGVVEWVDAETIPPCTGDYSVKMFVVEGHAGGVGVYIPVNVAIKDIESLSFARLGSIGDKDAKINLLIDADNDGDLDFTEIDALEYHGGFAGPEVLGEDAMLFLNPHDTIATDTWATVDAYNYKYFGKDKTCTDPTILLSWSPYNDFLGQVGGVQDVGVDVGVGVIDPTDKVLGVIVLLGCGSKVDHQTVYIDDITINGAPYDLEWTHVPSIQVDDDRVQYPDAPFQTIQGAIDCAQLNDTINVATGIYNLTAPIAVTGSVTITGDIDIPSNVVINAATTGNDRDCFQVKASGVTIQGFTIQGALDAPGEAAGTQNSGIVIGDWWVGDAIPGLQNIVISYNDIAGNSKGISVYRAQHVTISYNKIHDSPISAVRPGSWPGKGILLYGDDPATETQNLDVVIFDNKIYDNDLMGIELNYSETSGAWVDADVLIDTNIIYNNGGPWADIWDPGWEGGGESWIVYRGISANGKVTGVTINNNEIYDHGSGTGTAFRTDGSSGAIRVASCKGWTITNNDIYDNMRGIHIYDGEEHLLPDSNTGHVITGNNIYGNAQGIATFRGDVGYAHNNNIHGNKVTTWAIDDINPYSAVNLGEGTFDATNNWWGNASGPQCDEAVYESYGAKVSAGVGYNPWLLEPVTKAEPTPPTFEKTLALQDGWTLISVDKAVAEAIWVGTNPLVEEVLEETIMEYKYTPTGGFVSEVTTADLEPLTALYVLTKGGGGVSFKYAEVGDPTFYSKELEAGWNLISSPSTAFAGGILSPVAKVTIGAQQGVGLSTLVSLGDYNQFSDSFSLATLTDADWGILNDTPLNPFDGYWAYMNAAKSFEVPVQ